MPNKQPSDPWIMSHRHLPSRLPPIFLNSDRKHLCTYPLSPMMCIKTLPYIPHRQRSEQCAHVCDFRICFLLGHRVQYSLSLHYRFAKSTLQLVCKCNINKCNENDYCKKNIRQKQSFLVYDSFL